MVGGELRGDATLRSRPVTQAASVAKLSEQSWGGALLTRVAGALDLAVLRGMALAFETALLPPLEDFQNLGASAQPYVSPELRENPRKFFAFLDAMPAAASPIIVAHRDVAGGSIVTRCFSSGYVPYHPVAADPADCPENDTIWVEHWTHVLGRPRPTVLALHGFTMGWPQVDAQVLMAEHWFHLGCDVALLTLPFHGARASRRCRYSGERFASWHVGRLNEAVRQAVHDACLVACWLAAGGAPVGVLGMSLGGYIAALLSGLRTDLAFAIAVVPPVCLGDLPTRLFAYTRYGRAGVDPPLTPTEQEAAYRVHSPLTYPLSLPRERVLIVAGRGDGVTPVSHAVALWEHWGHPAAVWFSGGHVTPFQRSRIAAAIAAHLKMLGMVPADVDTPRSSAAVAHLPVRGRAGHAPVHVTRSSWARPPDRPLPVQTGIRQDGAAHQRN
jgi:hypothetical protein